MHEAYNHASIDLRYSTASLFLQHMQVMHPRRHIMHMLTDAHGEVMLFAALLDPQHRHVQLSVHLSQVLGQLVRQ